MEKNQWEEWNVPNEEDEFIMTGLILKHTKIIDPEIVKHIVDDNNMKQPYFKELLFKNNIKSEIYLWDNSPIAFPGIRRHVGTSEISKFKKRKDLSKSKNALFLDDNSFPKMIWAFIMTGKRYSVSNSPRNFSLAHIIDHKDYRSKRDIDILNYEKSKIENFYAGMFTNIVNTIYIPETLLKPTDFNSNIRNVFIQVMDKYYGNICQILPHNQVLKLNNIKDKWKIENFPPPVIVGNKDYVDDFIKYRENLYMKFE